MQASLAAKSGSIAIDEVLQALDQAYAPRGPEVIERSFAAARSAGTVTAYDVNFREALYDDFGGSAAAKEANRRVLPLVDVLVMNERDGIDGLGYTIPGVDPKAPRDLVQKRDDFAKMMNAVAADFPAIKIIATSLRHEIGARRHLWSGMLRWYDGEIYYPRDLTDPEEMRVYDLPVVDRVGGGDTFKASLLAYLYKFPDDPQGAIEFACCRRGLGGQCKRGYYPAALGCCREKACGNQCAHFALALICLALLLREGHIT